MANIDIERSHHLGIAGARSVVDKIAADMQKRLGVTHQWQGDVLQFSGTGVHGAINVSEDAVRITAQLGMLLSAFRAKIEQDISEKLDRHLA